jgi:hypothetical protein
MRRLARLLHPAMVFALALIVSLLGRYFFEASRL